MPLPAADAGFPAWASRETRAGRPGAGVRPACARGPAAGLGVFLLKIHNVDDIEWKKIR